MDGYRCSPASMVHVNILIIYSDNMACIVVQVTIYHSLLIGRDGHLDQSEAYDIS